MSEQPAPKRRRGKDLERPLQRKINEIKASAERIYRNYCRGEPKAEGAIAHVVKTLEFQGIQHTADEVRQWVRLGKWDEKIAEIDAKIYGALTRNRVNAKELTDHDYADLQAVKAAVIEMQDLAANIMAKAGEALVTLPIETVAEAVQVAQTGRAMLESSLKLRETLQRLTPDPVMKDIADVDGRPVEAQVLPAATSTVPNLAAAVAQFERAAREGKKH